MYCMFVFIYFLHEENFAKYIMICKKKYKQGYFTVFFHVHFPNVEISRIFIEYREQRTIDEYTNKVVTNAA